MFILNNTYLILVLYFWYTNIDNNKSTYLKLPTNIHKMFNDYFFKHSKKCVNLYSFLTSEIHYLIIFFSLFSHYQSFLYFKQRSVNCGLNRIMLKVNLA